MFFLNKIFTLLLLGIISLPAWSGGIIYLPENTPTLRKLDIPISEQQYEKFIKAKAAYFKNNLSLPDTFEGKLTLFELHNPQTEGVSFILGTCHNTPYEFLPSWFNIFLETKVKEIYIESELVTVIRSMTKGNSPGIETLDPETALKANTLLAPLLQIFSKSVEDISVGDIFCLIMIYDALLGMDASISMKALALNKPVFLLDGPIDCLNSNLNLYKAALQETAPTTLPSMSDEDLMHSYIKDEATALCHLPDLAEFLPQTIEKFKEFLKDLNNIETPAYFKQIIQEPDYQLYLTEERNARWLNFLLSANSPGKLICVGMNHLPDLLKKFTEKGYTIKKIEKSY